MYQNMWNMWFTRLLNKPVGCSQSTIRDMGCMSNFFRKPAVLHNNINLHYTNIKDKYYKAIVIGKSCNIFDKYMLATSVGICYYCTSSTSTANVNANILGKTVYREKNLLKRVLNKVGLMPNIKNRLRITSRVLYESVADRINYFSFFKQFHMPNTFNSWFLITEIHVWMLLVRAMAEGSESGENGRFLRNCIVEAMWGDVNVRAKKLGNQNMSRTREQIQELSQQFQAALLTYDEGIMAEDRILAAALWRRFFAMNCDDYRKIERMVNYVRLQVALLDQLPSNEFIHKPMVPWLDLDKIKIECQQ